MGSVSGEDSRRAAESSLVNESLPAGLLDTDESRTDLALARDGDDAAFTRLVGPLRRELHAHCYRMLGSTHDAEDALQDALLRAWRALARFEGRSSLRAWLYTVATRTCLDAVAARGRRALPVDLGPASDRAVLADVPGPTSPGSGPTQTPTFPPAAPEARYEQREAVELAFVAVLQHLPGNQRAALLLVDVLGFSPAEIAAMMATSTTSVNSALARGPACSTRRVPAQPTADPAHDRRRPAAGDGRRVSPRRWNAATPRRWSPADRGRHLVDAAASALVPRPRRGHPLRRRRPDDPVRLVAACTGRRERPGRGRQLPPARRPARTAWSVDVLTLRGDRIAEITSFIGLEHFGLFGLPTSLP